MKVQKILLMPIGKHSIMPKKTIYWTLQNKCPQQWADLFAKSNATISHQPLITLTINDNINRINEVIENYDTLIISSQFAAEKISLILKNKKYTFFIVGSQAADVLKRSGHNVLHISENSKELTTYLKNKLDTKILHLCSEKSNVDVWPTNVTALPFYGPKENTNFNLTSNNFESASIVVFGSPSGVDAWFTKDIDLSNTTIATIGSTTANRFTDYTNRSIITPKVSTISHLCNAIYKHLKIPEYERTK